MSNILTAHRHPTRVGQPCIRKGWLEGGPGPSDARGTEPFVAVSWDTALDVLSSELARVYGEHGPEAVFGGSYGWASAGRFHHAQSQLHRFLNCTGGYVASRNNYSYGASQVLLPHILGSVDQIMMGATGWPQIASHADMLLAFGGLPEKNTLVSPGGISGYAYGEWVREAAGRDLEIVNISPLGDDAPAALHPQWIALRPGTDTALILAMCQTLIEEGLEDRHFLETYTVGFDKLREYLTGDLDGVVKDPRWAESITNVPAATIRDLAIRATHGTTFVTTTWSLQRQHHGENAVWAALSLACMLGKIGLLGGGFGHGYGSMGYIGTSQLDVRVPSLSQGRNSVSAFVPVARTADMLLNPGKEFAYDGAAYEYPKIRLVYWCGGNPFHHHQDLAKLTRAFAAPETIVVHDSFWTATARRADIVLPATMSIERNDLACGKNDRHLYAMHALVEPYGSAWNDFDIFAELSRRLGHEMAFTEARTEMGWIEELYSHLADDLNSRHPEGRWPTFQEFWESGELDLPVKPDDQVLFAEFRQDPSASPLETPSGRIELFSSTIAGFRLEGLPGYACWAEPEEWLGAPAAERFPFHLLANQPRTKLHSQLDVGDHSRSEKVSGRARVRMNPTDGAEYHIKDDDIVLLSNDHGRCLAAVRLDQNVRRAILQLSTGAWYDPSPEDPAFCRHGNPNVLVADRPTSLLSQATAGQHALVSISRWTEDLPGLVVDEPPLIVDSQSEARGESAPHGADRGGL